MDTEKEVLFKRFQSQYDTMKALFGSYPRQDCLIVVSRWLANEIEPACCDDHRRDLWEFWHKMLNDAVVEFRKDGANGSGDFPPGHEYADPYHKGLDYCPKEAL